MVTRRTREKSSRGPAARGRAGWHRSGTRRLGFRLAVALPMLAAAPAAASIAGASPAAGPAAAGQRPACGTYQCFYYASSFLRSRPAPATGQVATVPLATRAVRPAPGAPSLLAGLDNGARAYWAVSDGFAQGRSGRIGGVPAGNVYNFDHWQYVDELYYYVHDTVSVPPTQWVNAGHRNGVAVLGTVTGDCGICQSQARLLFTPAHERATVRLLYRYAAAYGFDGWMIDMEHAFQPGPGVLAAVRALAARRLPDGRPLRVIVYRGGEYALQPASRHHRTLLPYFRAGAGWQADYPASPPPPAYPPLTYRTLAGAGLGGRHLLAYWSSYVYSPRFTTRCQPAGHTTTAQIWNGNAPRSGACLSTQRLFGDQRTILPGPHAAGPGEPASYTSTGLFAPGWTYFGNLPDPPPGQVAAGPASRALAHAADDALWVGARVRYQGPACTRSGTANAVSALITPRSPVGRLPFVTSFGEGEGDTYAIGGTVVAARPWNDLSAQDVLPTWSCTRSGGLTAAPVYATAVDGDAFSGGSSLGLTGRGPGEVALYAARIPVASASRPMLAFTSKVVTGGLPYVRVTFSDGASDVVRRGTPGRGWQQTVSPLRARGATIVRISAGVTGGSGQDRILLGQLRLYDAAAATVPSPIAVTPAGRTITWRRPAAPAIAYWNVYARSGGCLRFLGPAFTASYSLAQPMFGAGPRAGRYLIQPVSTSGAAAPVGRTCAVRGGPAG